MAGFSVVVTYVIAAGPSPTELRILNDTSYCVDGDSFSTKYSFSVAGISYEPIEMTNVSYLNKKMFFNENKHAINTQKIMQHASK